MANDTAVAASEYWGYLIRDDKSPTPIFEQLLLGIAHYINKHIAPWDTYCLTPAKLAAFYRLVGGDYDLLFLETPQSSLSFIYQSLGCYHTLQPEKDPYTPPTTPALTAQGFVRWQTVQLLLEPAEHVPFLQEAVKRFEITNPTDGRPFPPLLPKESLPNKPDLEMTEWHDRVGERLMLEAQASQRNTPDPSFALNDGHSDTATISSIDDHSVVDAAGYFSDHNPRSFARFPGSVRAPSFNLHPSRPSHTRWPSHEGPWSPERRRSSLPNNRYQPDGNRPCRSATIRAPTSHSPYPDPRGPHHHHHRRPRSSSTLSTSSVSSTTDSSSVTTSSASMSPVRYHTHVNPPAFPPTSPYPPSMVTRPHSAHAPYNPRDYLPVYASAPPPVRSGQLSANGIRSHMPTNGFVSPPPAVPNARGLNVKWRDTESIVESKSAPGTPPGGRYAGRSANGAGTGKPLMRGVGNRRYPDQRGMAAGR